MGRVKLFSVLALACFTTAACNDNIGPETRITGPVGTEYSIHPIFEATGRERIAGCCSFETGTAKVRKSDTIDLDGREIVGEGYHATFSFGTGAISMRRTTEASQSEIDGVELAKHFDEKPELQQPNFVYTALIPLNAEADAKKIDPPELEILGWCEDRQSCGELRQILDSVRF